MGSEGPRPDRILVWDGCVNARDLGGLAIGHGRRTAFGAVVRADNPAFLTERGWIALDSYGIRTVVALRTVGAPDEEPDESLIPDQVDLLRVLIEDVTDQEFLRTRVETRQWGTPLYFADALVRWPAMAAEAVRTVASAKPGGVVISCGRGCDRTGFLAALLLHLVGVGEADIVEDYCASWSQWSARDPDYPSSARQILADHGVSATEAFAGLFRLPIESLLGEAGLNPSELGLLRERMTAGNR